jgi:hypothetical protein
MKFYSVKALVLTFTFIGLCSASPLHADLKDPDKYVINIPWVNIQVDDVCSSLDDSPSTCGAAVQKCRQEVQEKIRYKINNLESCPMVDEYVWECTYPQANNVMSYIDSTLKGTAWGHPESVENAKKCVASVKSFPSGTQPPAAATEDKPETIPVKGEEIIAGFCGVPPSTEKATCKTAKDNCRSKTATTLMNLLINAQENPTCSLVMTPAGPRNLCETCEVVEIGGESQHACTPATLDQIKTILTDMDTKEGFSKEVASTCSNLKMGDDSYSSAPPLPPMVDGRPDSTAANPSFQTTGTNAQGGGSGCSLNSSKPTETILSLGMAALALVAALALHLSKRKSL